LNKEIRMQLLSLRIPRSNVRRKTVSPWAFASPPVNPVR